MTKKVKNLSLITLAIILCITFTLGSNVFGYEKLKGDSCYILNH